MVGELCESSAKDLGLKAGVKIGSGVIDAYAGWVGTVGSKVDIKSDGVAAKSDGDDQEQLFHRLAVVAGTSSCHLIMSKDAVFVPGVWYVASKHSPMAYLTTSIGARTEMSFSTANGSQKAANPQPEVSSTMSSQPTPPTQKQKPPPKQNP